MLLILGVDGTLYPSSTGIDAQIAARESAWCEREWGLSAAQCDKLRKRSVRAARARVLSLGDPLAFPKRRASY